MVDTVRTLAALQALLADNTDGDISAQDVRDFLVSVYPGPSGANAGLLATTVYDPGTLANYNTATGSLVALDTTNLRLSFTAPSSGNVLVKLSALCRVTAASTGLVWGLLDGASPVSDAEQLVLKVSTDGGENAQHRPNYSFLVTGLTADQSYDFDWAQLRENDTGGGVNTFAGGDVGAAIMEAWAA